MRPFEKLAFWKWPPPSFEKSKPHSQGSGPRSSFGSAQISPSPPRQSQVEINQLLSLPRPSTSGGKGRNFGSLVSLRAVGGRHMRVALVCLSGPWVGGLNSGDLSPWLSFSIPTPPAYVFLASIVSFLWLGVCEGSGTSSRSRQDLGKGHSIVGRTSRSRLLQSLFFSFFSPPWKQQEDGGQL